MEEYFMALSPTTYKLKPEEAQVTLVSNLLLNLDHRYIRLG